MKSLLMAFTAITLAHAAAHADTAFHGLLLFGDKTLYASHLPMFHAPHDYQVIMKVTLSDVGCNDTVEEYADAKSAGQIEFTLAPNPFDLAKVIAGQKMTLQADLYKGHFEHNGVNIGPVLMTIEKVIYSSHLNPADVEQNKYLLFGQNNEYFAAHVINGKPSFDTIMSVSQPFTLQFHACRAVDCPPWKNSVADSELPKISPYIPGQGESATPVSGNEIGDAGEVGADVQKVLYFETGDLK